MNNENIRLTSSEIAALWTTYMNVSMIKQLIGYLLKHIQDSDIKPLVQTAYETAAKHLEELELIFEKEHFAKPNGFSEEDVNMDAPWLYTDTFSLNYVSHMARVAMVTYSGFLGISYKKEVRDSFTEALREVTQIYNHALDIALAKGITSRHPYIEVPSETDYVDSKKYFSGLNPFSEKRPLNAIEITHLYMNVVNNTLGAKLSISFAQTSPTKEVQEFMVRSNEVAQKHIKVFADIMMKEEMIPPNTPDVSLSNSTTQTFSDRLMMFQMALLTATGIGNYATSASVSQRSDLAMNYERLSAEISKLAKSGADLMIQNGWMEQPPGIKDRGKLIKDKEKADQ
ncbi:hypothetical protein JOD29_003615 [Lysinibacillus composti]|uniref:DUF3231 family protein n=1 Tax=Lysinibacillus composti TaxID=720633 RepID=A0A3N9UMS0_9BACI|nr:DUF3231 family protein [Lysinibacillus composti]MBM7610335.1 hypothetical protein [Lysinibacillus composti]RQW73792.1 DUF3231 family protein [Lysinibacillus composti]